MTRRASPDSSSPLASLLAAQTPDTDADMAASMRGSITRGLLWFVGGVSLALGIIGVFLPVMPTTPFVLLAAACWSRASPRLHRRLLANRYFGPLIRNWEQHRSLPLKVKIIACSLMAVSISTSIWLMRERFWIQIVLACIALIGVLVIWWLPTRELNVEHDDAAG